MSTTGIVLTGCVIVLAIYDLIVVLKKGVGCSVSRAIQKAGFCSPIFSICIGMLLGHFFLHLDRAESVVAIPENIEKVSVVRIEDLKMNAVFVPDGITASLTDDKTGKKFGCPKPMGTQN